MPHRIMNRILAGSFAVRGGGAGKKRKKRKPTPIRDKPNEYRMSGPITVAAVSIWLPIRTVSEMNQREHWAVKMKRKKAQQAIVRMKGFQGAYTWIGEPYQITLTRIGPRLLDDDNAAASLKHVQDQVARELEIDDGDRTKATWRHNQLKQPFYAVRVHIEKRKDDER